MASVDDRIVGMHFDNAAFEQKVSSTIAAIDKLKTSLDFAGATKNVAELQSASNNFNLHGISSSLETIAGKFTMMGAIAFSVLQNITNKVVDTGIQLAKSLSLDQVISGFREYETNLNAIQTVLANTRADGTNLQDVNAALDQLNQYSDQTIYNFGEMARNIGTFTAAGVDLDTSVNAIKGIANLAAISGSNSQQASTAMYQLSQAIAAGSVKLMDWNSIVNAGMGGEVFQKALFETGKTMGTIADVPMDMTFEEWTKAGNTFRGSLEDGWLTAEVLTNTLSGFTGDLTDAQLMAMGYTEQQIKEIQELGKVGQDAATKVKTMTQLIGTVKESIGSGWSATFRILIGDFEEAKELFTGLSDTIGGIVGASADSRNALLEMWKNMGGRDTLIEALTTGFKSLGAIMTRIKRAFEDVFPPMTATRLILLTDKFKAFMDAIAPSQITLVKIRDIFTGIFSAFSIAIEIVKEVAKAFGTLFEHFRGAETSTSGILGFFAQIGEKITHLREILVDQGGIAKFFEDIPTKIITFVEAIQSAISKFVDNMSFDGFVKLLQKLKDELLALFGGGSGGGESTIMSDAVDLLAERFGFLGTIVEKIGAVFDWVVGKFQLLKDKLGGLDDILKEAFGNLGVKIGEILADTDYDQALDTVNTGLFAGLVLLVKKFLDNGIDFGGMFDGVNEALQGLTGTLEAMQLKLKAEALLDIAKALALLVASLVVLSLIDSGALTKAFAAIAVGFGQLVTAMALLTKLTAGPASAISLGIVSASVIAIAGAILVLSLAAKMMSTMDWDELAKGLIGVGVLLAALVLAVNNIDSSGGMIAAGIGMIAIAVALNILALAVKSFAEMSWEEMAQGLVGVAGGLTALVLAVRSMPSTGLVGAGIGLIGIATAMNILALAMKSFAEMSWHEMAKGMVGVGGGLLLIVLAMRKMPKNLVLQGAGMLMIGIGLAAMAKAIAIMGKLSWEELGKGLAGLAGSLLLLAAAAYAMQSSLGGAIAIAIMSVSLGKLADAVVKFSNISWSDLLHGLGALAATLGVLAIAGYAMGPVVGILVGLGVALLAVGAGIVLFGAGAFLLATAFSIIATSGSQGIATLASALDLLIEKLPAIIGAFAEGMLLLAQKVLDALPGLIAALSLVIAALIQLVIDNIPNVGAAISKWIEEILRVIREAFPDIVDTGFTLLMELLRGIEENIAEITTTVASIITQFLTSLAAEMPDLVTAGLDVLVAFLQGISDNLSRVVTAVADLILDFLYELALWADDIVVAGTAIVTSLIEGIGEAAGDVVSAAVDTAVSFMEGLVSDARVLADGIFNFMIELLAELRASIDENIPELQRQGRLMAGAILNGMTFGLGGQIGDAISGGSMRDLIEQSQNVGQKVVDNVNKPIRASSPAKTFIEMGQDVLNGLIVGLTNTSKLEDTSVTAGETVVSSMKNTLGQLPKMLEGIEEFNPTITPVLDLTQVEKDASRLGYILGSGDTMGANLSYDQAASVLRQQRDIDAETITSTTEQVPREITFTQINQSPEALSTADIYRNTRNLVNIAKEELSIP